MTTTNNVNKVEVDTKNGNAMMTASPGPGSSKGRMITPDSKNKTITVVTPKTRKVRRRQDGSPIVALNLNAPTKTIYIMRHGQSQGQVAHQNGMCRRQDKKLLDCGLTEKGQMEALNISTTMFPPSVLESIQLVLSSPLTRALHTALLGFPMKNILVHFDLREIGSSVPENVPRDMKHVVKDLHDPISQRDPCMSLDVTSLQPPDWPRDYSPIVVRRDRIRRVFQWIYQDRPETTLAIVCHYNVIRAAVVDGEKLKPANSIPIRCKLYSNGDLILDE